MGEISRLAIIKVLDKNTQITMILKLNLTQNVAKLDVTNSGLETVIFNLQKMMGILDLRSIG